MLSPRNSPVRAAQRDLPFVPALRRLGIGRVCADAAYLLVAVGCWSLVNLLAALGLALAAFLLISHFDFGMFIGQIDNLTSRFVAADPARQEAFRVLACRSFAVITLIVFAVRAPRFVSALRRELATRNPA